MIISLKVQSRVQRRRHISVHIQPSPTAFLVFTRGAHPKPTRLNLNRRGCVMGFVAAMVTGLLFTSAFTSKIALFRAGYPLQRATHVHSPRFYLFILFSFFAENTPQYDLIQTAASFQNICSIEVPGIRPTTQTQWNKLKLTYKKRISISVFFFSVLPSSLRRVLQAVPVFSPHGDVSSHRASTSGFHRSACFHDCVTTLKKLPMQRHLWT